MEATYPLPVEGVAELTNAQKKALSLLRCSLCKRYMKPPFQCCINNHNSCGDCISKQPDSCWKCQQRYSTCRNDALEKLALMLRYPCQHKGEGCEENFVLAEINQHEKHCIHRIYECILSKRTNCSWRGKLSWMHYHVSIMHPSRALVFPEAALSDISWQITKGGCFTTFTHVVFAFGEVFLYHKMFDYDSKRLCIAVQYFGPCENALKFKYKLKLIREDGKQVLSMSHVVHDEEDSIDVAFVRGNCVVVYYDTLALMANSINTFKIYKVAK